MNDCVCYENTCIKIKNDKNVFLKIVFIKFVMGYNF